MTLRLLHGFAFDADHLWPVLMPWALFAIGAAVFWSIGRWLRLPRASIGALTLVGGFGNTSFVGLPMIESLHGGHGVALGLLIDQLGSYLALSTVGVLAATLYAAEVRPTLRAIAGQGCDVSATHRAGRGVAVAARTVSTRIGQSALARIGDMLAPLALLSVGLQLRFDALRAQARLLGLGLSYKLMACPALVMAVMWLLDAGTGTTAAVSVIEAAMPPMIGAGIVAAQAKLDAPLVSTMIGIGTPLGLSTAPAWHWLLGVLVRDGLQSASARLASDALRRGRPSGR